MSKSVNYYFTSNIKLDSLVSTDGFVVRGCISQLLPGEAARCTIGRDCKTCEGDNCNGKLEFQSCYTCNSASDPNCLEIQDPNKSVKTTCSSYLDACVTYIGKDELCQLIK